ncbi:DUF3068 domain-containing protein [Actinoplanes couchii]|uniref:DUF3068 domain-containing protein n=1 Tax=Actinoplanes couchii TaxID=403638 RepID=A0ABQ3X7G9_9ACTN|nr:DUF3068 domain-containing protein [Actinoplanes couchii]MDR6322275.1 hypothetical protein [Actinoplanes couchii]GID54434.1 hypothetical protein Aco03nite_028380 [Actinoplanes couchii]
MKARLGAVLFGIGFFAVVLAAGVAFYVAPSAARLPYDLKLCTPEVTEDCLKPSVAEAKNARFLNTEGGTTPVVEIATGTLQSTTEIKPLVDTTNNEIKNGAIDDNTVIWNAFGTVIWTEKDKVVSAYEARLALDRQTAGAIKWPGQELDDVAKGLDTTAEVETVGFSGQLYKFPFNTEQKTYQYFDRDLKRTFPIEFKGIESIQGLETYKFEQAIPETALDFDEDRIKSLLGAFAGPDATSGQVVYSNTRTIWVEPVGGTFIKVQEQQNKKLVPSTGQPTELLNGVFVYTDQTVANSVESASATKAQVLLISRYVPIGLSTLGVILLIVGLLLVTSARTASPRHAAGSRTEEITGQPASTSAS